METNFFSKSPSQAACAHATVQTVREYDNLGDGKIETVRVCEDCGLRLSRFDISAYCCQNCRADVGSADLSRCDCGLNLCGDCRDEHPCVSDEALFVTGLAQSLADAKESLRRVAGQHDPAKLEAVIPMLREFRTVLTEYERVASQAIVRGYASEVAVA